MPESRPFDARRLDAQPFDGTDSDVFIGQEPSWLVRSGISLVASALVLGLIFAGLIRYPDVVQAPIVLTTAEPPTKLVSRVDGRIERLSVQDAEEVKEGQPLLWLESDVRIDQLRRLEEAIAALEPALRRAEPFDPGAFELGGLGSLQPATNRLAEALRDHGRFLESSRASDESRHADAQRRRYLTLQKQLDRKRRSLERKLAMQRELLDGSRTLADQGLLPKAQPAALESRWLDQKLALDDLDMQAETYELQLQEIDHRLQTLRVTRQESEQRLGGEVRDRLRELSSAIAAWRLAHVPTAPVDGRVTLTRFWSAHQEVRRGEVLLIVSADSGRRVGKVTVDPTGVGKIRPGQRVSIHLAGFPPMEHGSLEAKIAAVATVPEDGAYRVDVELPEPFVTTYGRTLPFTPDMVGTAHIITEDRRLLGRLFDKLLYLLRHHLSTST